MKNSFEVRGDETVIFLNRKNGSVIETTIDTDMFPLANEFQGTWHPKGDSKTNSYYVQGHVHAAGKQKIIRLHRLITQAPKDMFVDHINHDTLDNRRSNLRLATHAENHQNRKGANKNSKSGIQGVSWNARNKIWIACMRLNGTTIHLGCFSDTNTAEEVVKAARGKLMPFSQEAMRNDLSRER